MRFPPIRKKIPLYLGSQSKRMLELIGEIGDGGLPLLFPPEYYEEVVERIKIGANRAGKSIDDIDIVGCIWFSIAENREAARDALRDLVTFYGPHLAPEMISKIGLKTEDFDQIRDAYKERDTQKARDLMTDEMASLAIYGTPDDCIERINSLIKKGLKHVRFGPPLGPDPVKTISLIGEKIIPYFENL